VRGLRGLRGGDTSVVGFALDCIMSVVGGSFE